MTTESTFAVDWITIGAHRVKVHERDGAPGKTVRRLAMLAAWYLEDDWTDDADSYRVVESYMDNRHTSYYYVTVAGDTPPADGLFVRLRDALSCFVPSGTMLDVIYKRVARGRVGSDSYDRTEHLVTAKAAETIQYAEGGRSWSSVGGFIET